MEKTNSFSLRSFFVAIHLVGIFLLTTTSIYATLPSLSIEQLETPPPRIIRPCCSFGSDLNLAFFPIKVTNITGVDLIGEHQYLGDKSEANGIIYTTRGGFIDLGHLRDQADWTAYLASLILQTSASDSTLFELGHEGGEKLLQLHLPAQLDSLDAYLLASKIAYDLSVWHEIATWFGSSYLPLFPERYSSFSVEDAYSNLLGSLLGVEALKSDLPYEVAMDSLIKMTLQELGAVATPLDTYEAMETVESVWWTRSKHLPSRKILLQRQLEVYQQIRPWLVDDSAAYAPILLDVPHYTSSGHLLGDLYQLQINLNRKVPFKRLFPQRLERTITSTDFAVIIEWVRGELQDEHLKEMYRADRKKGGAR